MKREYIKGQFIDHDGNLDLIPYLKYRKQKQTERNRRYAARCAKDPDKVYWRYKYAANKRGIKFGMTIEDVKQLAGQPCHYCGDPAYGIDRVDNKFGYIEGNIEACCGICNKMKCIYSVDMFLDHIRKIYLHHYIL